MSRHEGIVMDGPLRGERRAHHSAKMHIETQDEEQVILPIRMSESRDVTAMVRRSYTYVWVEAGLGRLPGWYLQ